MLDDAVNQRRSEGKADGVRVIDIAQVLEDSLALRRKPAAVGAETGGAPGAATTDSPLEESTSTGPSTAGPQDGPSVVDPSDRRPGSTETVVEDADSGRAPSGGDDTGGAPEA
jgi:hypothetical protein